MKKKKEVNDIDCDYIKYCGIDHCNSEHNKGNICSDCEHYIFWDSANGECFGHPPELVTRWSWRKFRLVHSYETRIVPWCAYKCGIFKLRKIKDKK